MAEHPAGRSHQVPGPFAVSETSILKKAEVPPALPAVPTLEHLELHGPGHPSRDHPWVPVAPPAPSCARNEGRHHRLLAPTCSACGKGLWGRMTRVVPPQASSLENHHPFQQPLCLSFPPPCPRSPFVGTAALPGAGLGTQGRSCQHRHRPPAPQRLPAAPPWGRGCLGDTGGHWDTVGQRCQPGHTAPGATPAAAPTAETGSPRRVGDIGGHRGGDTEGLPQASGGTSPHSRCLSPPVPARVSPVSPLVSAA